MIGNVVRQQRSPEKPKVSTLLRDTLLENWKEARTNFAPTLVPQENPDDVWKEFWLYASGTKNWCPRMCALNALNGAPDSNFKAETLWNFGQGNALHWLFQNDMLRSLGIDFLGSWERYVNSGVQRASGDTWVKQIHPEIPDNTMVPEGHEIVRGWAPVPEDDGNGLSLIHI